MKFLSQAFQGKSEPWRYVIGLLFIFAGWQVVGSIPLLVAAAAVSPSPEKIASTLAGFVRGEGIDSNLFLILMIISFAAGLLFTYITIRFFHARKWVSVLTARTKTDWSRIRYGFILWMSVNIIVFIIEYLISSENFEWNFKAGPFFTLLAISLFLLPIQTSFEEIFFRGYLMQAIGRWIPRAWVPLIITSVIFGWMHGANPEVDKLGSEVFIFYIGTGLLFGMITLLDEGMEINLGMHAANNIFAAVWVTNDWSVFQTPALFIDKTTPDIDILAYVPVFIIYPAILFILSKKYKWKNFKQKLTGRIH